MAGSRFYRGLRVLHLRPFYLLIDKLGQIRAVLLAEYSWFGSSGRPYRLDLSVDEMIVLGYYFIHWSILERLRKRNQSGDEILPADCRLICGREVGESRPCLMRPAAWNICWSFRAIDWRP